MGENVSIDERTEDIRINRNKCNHTELFSRSASMLLLAEKVRAENSALTIFSSKSHCEENKKGKTEIKNEMVLGAHPN